MEYILSTASRQIVAQSCEQSPSKCQTKGSENVAMSKHTELPSETDDPNIDLDLDVDPVPAATPARFGRLALWVASASALTVGVVGTVAYGVWFNQDQHAYAEAMARARQTLSVTESTSATQRSSSTGQVAPSSSPPGGASVASVNVNAPVPSPGIDRRAVRPPDSAAPKLATARLGRASCPVTQDRRRPAPRVKPNGGLFARLGSFFHRVSYRQHGNENQRDIYAHS
jgi:hypothetical protein